MPMTQEMESHLRGDTTIGPLGDLTGDIYRLLQEARSVNNQDAIEILAYVHERICRARHEISGEPVRTLPPRPSITIPF